MKKCLALFLFLTSVLGAQELEYVISPSDEVRFPPDRVLTENGSTFPVTTQETSNNPINLSNESGLVVPLTDRLVPGSWYLNLGQYSIDQDAQSTANGLYIELSNRQIGFPGIAFSQSILYLGPLARRDVFYYSAIISSLGWRNLEIYRP